MSTETSERSASTKGRVLTWIARALSALAVIAVVWVLATGWSGITHAHPAYPVLLVLTVAGAAISLIRSRRERPDPRGFRLILRVLGLLGAAVWIGIVAWLAPASAQEPALSAMATDSKVTVVESATQIVLTPAAGAKPTGLFFQPGAKVDARSYAAVLRPLAEAGHLVVIPKQPLSIAFLSTTAFASSRSEHPEIKRWVVGGHSLGGTVAAIDADAHDQDAVPVVGLLFYASYPASDISKSLSAAVLSISGSKDGLATPAKVDASKAQLPADSMYLSIDGASHAYFGDYGMQAGDGTATIGHDEARTRITSASLKFLGMFP